MDRFPAPIEFLANRRTLAWLLVPAMLLPVAATVLSIFSRIFALLDDALSASILDWTALSLGILWCLSLVLLLLCTVLLLLLEDSCERPHKEPGD